MRKYYNILQNGKTADVLIYGDITSWPWEESDVSGFSFKKELDALGEVDEITVHIDSYGGEVSEGFTVYNALKNHPAKITTIVDGFACSAASVVFMAGDDRIMNPLSALWIHNVQVYADGDGNAHRKAAETSDLLTAQSKVAYLSAGLSITDEKLTELMDSESWIMPEAAVKMGFATAISDQSSSNAPAQCARRSLFNLLMNNPEHKTPNDDPQPDPEPTPEPEPVPEPTPAPPPEPTPQDKNAASKLLCGFLNALINKKED